MNQRVGEAGWGRFLAVLAQPVPSLSIVRSPRACRLAVSTRSPGSASPTKHDDDTDPTFTFFQADYETSYLGTPLGVGGPLFRRRIGRHRRRATSLITDAADAAFNIQGAGYRGTHPFPLGGATGLLTPRPTTQWRSTLPALGRPHRTSPLAAQHIEADGGQSSVSLATLPAESDLPNMLGIPFSSQYPLYIQNDHRRSFHSMAKTIRTPQIQFIPLGSGGQGITAARRSRLTIRTHFCRPPIHDRFQ